jgi:hypothetical protein
MDKKVQASPFSKASAEVMVFSIVKSDRKKHLIIFVPKSKLVTTKPYQALLNQHVMLWLVRVRTMLEEGPRS